MALGQVKWFNRAKGFGIIVQDENTEVFVHYSQMLQGDENSLAPGDEVEFDLARSHGGLHALNVHRCVQQSLKQKEGRPQSDRPSF